MKFIKEQSSENPILEQYFEIRKELFQTKLLEVTQKSEYPKMIGYYQYLLEIGSVNMDFGRQTGSSYFLHWLLNDLTSDKQKAFVLFNDRNNIRYFTDIHIPVKKKTINTIDNHILNIFPKTIKYDENKNVIIDPMFRGRSFDFLIIDVSSIQKQHKLKAIIKMVEVNKPKMVIYL